MVTKIITLTLVTILSLGASAKANQGEAAGHKFTISELSEGLGIPWGIEFVNKNSVLVGSRNGNLHLVDLNSGNKKKMSGVPKVLSSGQGGLLDIARPSGSEWFYFTYSRRVDGNRGPGVTVLARAKLNDDLTAMADWNELLVTQSESSESRHYGSRIAFDNKGHLYFSIGDRGERDNGQDLSTHASTIVRLNLDGSVPNDNPFVDTNGALPEIWSYGHRNPQGLDFYPQTNQLWSIEHGPRGGDEINLIEKGKNYGWAEISYGREYFSNRQVGEGTHREGMEQPVKYYIPSIAPGSLVVYRGEAFPNWNGWLLSGALRMTHINMVEVSADNKEVQEVRILEDLNERIRDVEVGPEGWLYFTTDSGKLMVLKPA